MVIIINAPSIHYLFSPWFFVAFIPSIVKPKFRKLIPQNTFFHPLSKFESLLVIHPVLLKYENAVSKFFCGRSNNHTAVKMYLQLPYQN